MKISELAALAQIEALKFDRNDEVLPEKVISTFGTDVVEEKQLNFKQNPFNVYGQNIDNFFKFKKNDRHDALNATNKAATEINNMYNELKKDYPNADVEFEAPPNPADYGKKREGFHSYMQALERWENSCKEAIERAREEAAAKKKGNHSARKTDTPKPFPSPGSDLPLRYLPYTPGFEFRPDFRDPGFTNSPGVHDMRLDYRIIDGHKEILVDGKWVPAPFEPLRITPELLEGLGDFSNDLYKKFKDSSE